MGNINARCGISHQTIAPGDACRVVIVQQAESYREVELSHDAKNFSVFGVASEHLGPTCQWSPVSAFMPTTYEDFGLTDLRLSTNMERSEAAMLFAQLSQSALQTQLGTNKYHDRAFDLPNFIAQTTPGLHERLKDYKWTAPPVILDNNDLDEELNTCWNHLCDRVRCYRAFAMGTHQQPRQLAMFMVHEHAYQALIKEWHAARTWENESLNPLDFLARAVEEATKAKMERLEDTQTQPITSSVEQDAKWAFCDTFRSKVESYVGKNYRHSRVVSSARFALLRQATQGQLSMAELIKHCAAHLDEPSAYGAMDMLGFTMSPVTYIGEDASNRLGRQASRFISEVSTQVSQSREHLMQE